MLMDPDSHLEYGVDWSRWLADDETIVESEWIVPEPLEHDDDAHNGGVTVVWISGGVAGANYQITNRITTSAGRIDDRSITLLCRHR